MKSLLLNRIDRHQHPVSQMLHLIGIPLTFAGTAILVWQGHIVWAIASFVTGYVFQFIGHAFEGNDPGEVILITRWFGMPYTAIATRSSMEGSYKEPEP